jgi:hypothetical protein
VAEVHQQVIDFGAATARQLAVTKIEKQCVDTAAAVMQDDRFDLNILHSGFAMTALPHRKVDDLVWERTGGPKGELRLHIESGYGLEKDPVGIPYGAVARLILIYLSSEAVANNSRVVDLGRSMKQFLDRMGIPVGGKSVAMVRDQSRRISMCRLTFFNKRERDTLISNGSFVRNAVICDTGTAGDQQLRLWNDTVELDEAFFQSLKDHPLPLREAAIRQLSGRSMALDLYVYFSYRLHALEKPTSVSWSAMHQQFGGGFKERWVFVQSIKDPLALALAAYPEANVDINEGGLILHPSPSPVPKTHPWSKKAIKGRLS